MGEIIIFIFICISMKHTIKDSPQTNTILVPTIDGAGLVGNCGG
jgi:hypothetical protein